MRNMFDSPEGFMPDLLLEDRVKEALADATDIDADKIEAGLNWQELDEDQRSQVLDTVMDLVQNESEVVISLTGYCSFGGFPIEVRRFGPFFFVAAQEFDDKGFFPTAKDAEDFARVEYSSFIDLEGGVCPICGAPYDYESYEEQPCGHWVFTFEKGEAPSSKSRCTLQVQYGEGSPFDGRLLDVLAGAVERVLRDGPGDVPTRVEGWNWPDSELQALVRGNLEARGKANRIDSWLDWSSFGEYLTAISTQRDCGQQWSSDERARSPLTVESRILWAADAAGLGDHLCRTVERHIEALEALLASWVAHPQSRVVPAPTNGQVQDRL